jgi:hypothetical protein
VRQITVPSDPERIPVRPAAAAASDARGDLPVAGEADAAPPRPPAVPSTP